MKLKIILTLFLSYTLSIQCLFVIEPAKDIPDLCKSNCISEYGSEIGISSGIIAYSNCNDDCINEEGNIFYKEQTGFIRDVYVGMKWQCVEYARRWLIINQNVAFSSIDSAFQIFGLGTVEDLTKENTEYPFDSYPNGSKIPPKIGDLIIFPKNNLAPHGHVAVIVGVNFEKNYFEIAEENYNKMWDNPNAYSRRLIFFQHEGSFILTNTCVHDRFLYKDLLADSHINSVIGWKRVRKN